VKLSLNIFSILSDIPNLFGFSQHMHNAVENKIIEWNLKERLCCL
jgi:hypothetical protein